MSEEREILVKDKLQQFYLASRDLLNSGVIPSLCVQRSFEEAIAGYMGENCWRPSHVSRAAIKEGVTGTYRNLQRAHGVVEGRLDRFARTIEVLSGEAKDFETWWRFWVYHDRTILITRDEHNENKRFKLDDLIEVPQDSRGLFARGGFSFKMRKKSELAWMRSVYEAGL